MNDSFLRMIAGYQPQPWTSRNDGWKLADNLLIENDNMFDWSDLQQKSYGDEEVLDFILRFLAMADLKRALFCSFGLTKTLDFILRFLAMTELKRALFCSFGLTKTFHFMAHFLAMADLERARVCSFGLTKTFFNFNQFPQLRNLKI